MIYKVQDLPVYILCSLWIEYTNYKQRMF